jgi:hypothetical protein
MPLSKDEKGGGTEINGSKSTDYCSHCYRMGQFTDPYVTVEEMVAMLQGILKKRIALSRRASNPLPIQR